MGKGKRKRPAVKASTRPAGRGPGPKPKPTGEAVWQRAVLFWVFIVLFVAVFACTMLAVFAGLGSPTERERSILFNGFIVEIGAAVIALFYSAYGLIRKPGAPMPVAPPVEPISQDPSPTPVAIPKMAPVSKQPSAKALWSRTVPSLELGPKETVQLLRHALERIRVRACDRVRRIHKDVTVSDIRVHIVLPDYSYCKEIGTYELSIPEEFRIGGSSNDEDIGMAVWPDQGVAGRVFARQIAEKVVIVMGPDGVPLWPQGYEYTDTYKRCIPENLRWLAAVPLRVPSTGNDGDTMGVLGVQGLNKTLNMDEINAVVGYLMADVLLVAGLLYKLSPVRLSITKEEPKNGREERCEN